MNVKQFVSQKVFQDLEVLVKAPCFASSVVHSQESCHLPEGPCVYVGLSL